MMVRMRKGGLALLGMLLPDPKLEKAFDVLPLNTGDTAATGDAVHWYQDWVKHEDLTDEYWTQQSHTASVPDVTSPVLMVTGWYDIFLPWQLRNYTQLVEAGNQPRLTVGPWGHITPAKTPFAHADTVAFLKETFAGAPSKRGAPVRAYLTGAEEWRDLETWPPEGSALQDWFLAEGGRLSTDAASGDLTRYTYDPADPTPAVGGPSLLPKTTPVDNADHEKRPDVATFRSAPLTVAADVAGEPVARLRFRSSAPSYDVFVRITDIHPDGTSMTVCDGIRRIGSVATAATDPTADTEGFREVDVSLWPTFHRFAPGHRIGLQVSSGAHPRYARNPGTGQPAFEASETIVAHQEISHTGPHASRISLPMWSA